MEAEDLIPRLLLLGGLTAAIILYTRRRQSRVQEVTATATSAASNAAAQAADTATSVVGRSQHLLESV
ncbi:MAG TPA: hypothetical protein VHB98_03520, partial [Chloroflexota bacterium]|nr:hypothetical protein [Chloroflexota bacterium]